MLHLLSSLPNGSPCYPEGARFVVLPDLDFLDSTIWHSFLNGVAEG
jgi:hypothetical protein